MAEIDRLLVSREREEVGARWGLWPWVAVLLLVSVQWRPVPIVTLSASELAIPLAALLGYRYQRRGLVIVALGGLLLPIGWSYGSVSAGYRLDLYLAALLVCWLAAYEGPLVESIPTFRPSILFFAGFLMLPLAVGLYGGKVGDVEVRAVVRFDAILYLYLFVLGLSQLRAGVVITTITAFTLLGILPEILGLPRDARFLFGGPKAELPLYGLADLRYLWVDYGLDSPAELLTGLGYFLIGRVFRSMEEAHSLEHMPWYRTYGLIILLTVIGLGSELNHYAISALTGFTPPPHFRLLGSFYALPCAALLGGLLLRYRGILLVLVLVPFFWWLNGLILSGFDFGAPLIFFTVGDPIVVLGFGALGLVLRDVVLRTETVWWSTRWALYVLLLLVVLPSLIAPNSPLKLLVLAMGFVGTIALSALAAWLSKQLLGRLPTHGGWLSFVSLLFLGTILWQQRAAATAMIGRMPQVLAEILRALSGVGVRLELSNDTLIFPTLGLVLLWLLLSAAYGFLRHVPDCARDLKSLARALRMTPTAAEHARGDEAEPQVQPARGTTSLWIVPVQIIGVVRYLALGLAIALPLFVFLITVYPREGIGSVIREWFVTPPPPSVADWPRVRTDREPEVNRFLWQAAQEYVAHIPLLEVDPLRGSIWTDWYSEPGEPTIRRRIYVHVGRDLKSYAVQVHLRRQDRGLFGVWVEQGTFRDARSGKSVGHDIYPEREEIETKVLERAEELSKASPG